MRETTIMHATCPHPTLRRLARGRCPACATSELVTTPDEFSPHYWRGENITPIVLKVAELLKHGLVVDAGRTLGEHFGQRITDVNIWQADTEWREAWEGLDYALADPRDARVFVLAAHEAALAN